MVCGWCGLGAAAELIFDDWTLVWCSSFLVFNCNMFGFCGRARSQHGVPRRWRA